MSNFCLLKIAQSTQFKISNKPLANFDDSFPRFIKFKPKSVEQTIDQIFQKYITLLVYKLFKQDIKTITSLHIDSSWEQFVDKYPKSSQEYDWIDFRKKELNNQFNELFNIKKDETDTDYKDDIYYFFSKKAII